MNPEASQLHIRGAELLLPSGFHLGPLDLSIERGRIQGIAGPSGSGKSMLIGYILGSQRLVHPVDQGGSIYESWGQGQELIARDLSLRSFDQRSRFATVSQEASASLNPRLTLAQLAAPFSRIGTGSHLSLPTALERVGLAPKIANHYPHQLSGGMARRALVALALVKGSRWLLLDEVNAGLDEGAKAELSLLLKNLASDGMGILVVSHDMPWLLSTVGHLYAMDQGKLCWQSGESTALISSPLGPLVKSQGDELGAALREPQGGVPNFTSSAIEYRYGKRGFALETCGFQLAPGEALGVVGPSGSGKSSLLRILGGLVPPHRGRVQLEPSQVQWNRSGFTHPIAQDPSLVRRRWFSQLRIVEQDHKLAFDPLLSLDRSLSLGGVNPTRQEIEQVFATVGLDLDLLDRRPHQVSGGQRQRLLIARALLGQPRVLLLDEPAANLDGVSRSQVLELLLHLKQTLALSYVIVSHDLRLIARLCDHLIVLADGITVERGSIASVFESATSPQGRTMVKGYWKERRAIEALVSPRSTP